MLHGVRAVIAVAAVTGLTVVGCGSDDDISAEAPVATFQVVDEEFKVELATPELMEHARALLEGEQVSPIPIGNVVRDDPGVNEPWSWHIDPSTLEFADMTIEVCDGVPSYVEDETITSDQYCPWSAVVVAVEGG